MKQYTQPTLLINEAIARNNIKKMADKARRNKVSFEPHFKTHQSKEVGEWFRDEGVGSITVSSVSMAQYFSLYEWKKITIAFPVNILEISKINTLAQDVGLTLLVQGVETISKLNILERKVGLYIEVDAGYHRSGVAYDSFAEIQQMIGAIGKTKHSFKGFYYHAGNSYVARSAKGVIEVYNNFEAKMSTLKKEFKEFEPHIAIGDTPTCSVVNTFNGINSIHPGNFVYYDYTQVLIGACSLAQIATYLLCPVVAKSTARNELVIYGGGIHLSKESLTTTEGITFGPVGKVNDEGIFTSYPGSYLKSISQEHGIISSLPEVLASVQVGDLIAIIPIHSCMTVDCMSKIYTFQGDQITKLSK